MEKWVVSPRALDMRVQAKAGLPDNGTEIMFHKNSLKALRPVRMSLADVDQTRKTWRVWASEYPRRRRVTRRIRPLMMIGSVTTDLIGDLGSDVLAGE